MRFTRYGKAAPAMLTGTSGFPCRRECCRGNETRPPGPRTCLRWVKIMVTDQGRRLPTLALRLGSGASETGRHFPGTTLELGDASWLPACSAVIPALTDGLTAAARLARGIRGGAGSRRVALWRQGVATPSSRLSPAG